MPGVNTLTRSKAWHQAHPCKVTVMTEGRREHRPQQVQRMTMTIPVWEYKALAAEMSPTPQLAEEQLRVL